MTRAKTLAAALSVALFACVPAVAHDSAEHGPQAAAPRDTDDEAAGDEAAAARGLGGLGVGFGVREARRSAHHICPRPVRT